MITFHKVCSCRSSGFQGLEFRDSWFRDMESRVERLGCEASRARAYDPDSGFRV